MAIHSAEPADTWQVARPRPLTHLGFSYLPTPKATVWNGAWDLWFDLKTIWKDPPIHHFQWENPRTKWSWDSCELSGTMMGWASEIRITSCFNGGKHHIILLGFLPSQVVQDFATIHSDPQYDGLIFGDVYHLPTGSTPSNHSYNHHKKPS